MPRYWKGWRVYAVATTLTCASGIAMAQVPTISCDGATAAVLNTGVSANGSVDNQWRYLGLAAYEGAGAAGTTPASSYGPAYLTNAVQWYQVPASSPSKWIGASAGGGQPVVPGNPNVYRNIDALFRIDFNLDASVNPREFAPNMTYLADNSVVDIMVNGEWQGPLGSNQWAGLPQAGAANQFNYNGFGNLWRGASIQMSSTSWRTGANSLIVYVKSSPPLMGFLAQLNSSNICPNQVPVATPSLSGSLSVGAVVTGSYAYADANTDIEDDGSTGTTYRLIRSSDAVLTPASPITVLSSGATGGASVPGVAYTLQASDVGQYLYYCVTPAAQTGASPGVEACTAARGPVTNAVMPSVPTLSQWALMLLSMVLGLAVWRRRTA